MAKPLNIVVDESIEELESLKLKYPLCGNRLQMLILIKNGIALSKIGLASELKVSDRSVHQWRTNYINGGIALLLKDGRSIGKSKITDEIFIALSEYVSKLPKNKRVDALAWLETNYQIDMSYTALIKYLYRKFGPTRKRH